MYSELAAVERAMRILEMLADHPSGVGVMELAEKLDLQKSVVSKILSTLEAGGYVHQDPRTQLFALTWRMVAMVNRYLDALPFEEAARPVLRELAKQTEELVHLAVVEGEELIFVAAAEGARPLRVASLLGRDAPLHASAAGKLWLASMSEERALALVGRQGLPRLTPHTITDPVKLLEELRRIRHSGYSVAWEEVNETVVALAAPVTAADGSMRAALVVAFPVYNATPERVESIQNACIAAARTLSERLPPVMR